MVKSRALRTTSAGGAVAIIQKQAAMVMARHKRASQRLAGRPKKPGSSSRIRVEVLAKVAMVVLALKSKPNNGKPYMRLHTILTFCKWGLKKIGQASAGGYEGLSKSM